MPTTTPTTQPAEVAAFLANCPIIAPGPQISPLPSGDYAVQVTGDPTDPVVVILQRVPVTVRHPDGWMGTPARWYARTLLERPGGGLSIDFGSGWALPDLDAAAVHALAARFTVTTEVIVYGPNVAFADGAGLHVHRVGCAHLLRRPYSTLPLNSDVGGWRLRAATRADVIEAIYPAGDFDYDPTDPQQLEPYAADVTIFPCTGLA